MNECRDWAKDDPLMLAYHDNRWCKPCHDETELFAMLCLEGQQAGLSWSIIIRKEKEIRKAFDNFEIDRVAAFDDEKVESLLQNPEIIRSKTKINAAITNAKVVQNLVLSGEYKSFDEYIWHFTEGKQIIHHFDDFSKLPAKNELSEKVSKDMKKRGFKFVGPVICYSFLQGIGVIDDHLNGCPCKGTE